MNRKLQITILSISMITILGSTAVSPALAGIKNAFPTYSDDTIQLVLTIPPLFIIPLCFLCHPLSQRIGNKKTLILGIILYLIGGIGAGLMPNFYLMLAGRALLGVGSGLIMPMAQALIGAHFHGKTREKLTSYSASASYLMGIIASFVVSRLALISWRYAFFIYFIAIIVLILNMKYLPDDQKQREQRIKEKHHLSINWKAFGMVLAMIGVNIAFYTFSTSIALHMKNLNIGSDALSGYAVSLFMLFGFITGLCVPYLRSIFQSYIGVLGCLMMASGYIGLALTTSLPVIFISSALIGGSYSVFYSSIFLAVGKVTRTAEENKKFVTYTTAGICIGQTISTYVLKIAEFIFQQNGYVFRFICLSVCLLLGAIIIIIVQCRNKRMEV